MDYPYCLDSAPNLFGLFDTTIAPPLLYYSYIPIVIVSIFFGFLVYNKKTRHLLQNRLLFIIIVSFSIFIINEIVQWIAVPTPLVNFGWQLAPLLQTFILLFSIYFISAFIEQKDVTFNQKIFLSLVALPVLILLPTDLNMKSFDLINCEANIGPLFTYVYVIEVLSIFYVLFICFRKYLRIDDKALKRQLILIAFGTTAFISILFASNIFGEIFATYEINLFGPIGMVIFLGLLSYLIVRFQTFNVKLIATQALVWVLAILIGSQFFFIKTPINFVLTGITFVASIILGYFLIQTVKREVEQRIRIEKLAGELKMANEGQTNLIHIINHQIKGYLAKSRDIFSELLTDASYGATDASKPMLEEGLKSLTEGVGFVKDFLDASNIEKGAYTYKSEPFDLKAVVTEVAEKEKKTAENKVLSFEVHIADGDYNYKGDKFQLGQAIRNLIDNSILYTSKGGLVASLERSNDKILFTVKDTGVGISDELKPKLFTKGGRDKDSVKININSTGFGLAFVKGVVEAHKGRVWAESAGPNQGSTFFMELPVNS